MRWFLIFLVGVGMSLVSQTKASSWGKSYFPNIPLTTHEGKEVRFFDDLIADRIVVVNFIYTTCPDTCPLETAQLVRVQEILGDRLGKDLFFYSISIDPENDTPEVLRVYRERFNARWTFLTGKDADIVKLRKKLGLYIPEIQDGSNNHNVSMIIGNQRTGRWMKRSPFENPYVLADQIGNWLDGWRRPPQWQPYLQAPKLRDLPRGEQIYRTRCASCHSIQGYDREPALGPDLLGVTRARDPEWLVRWLRAPDKMLADGDPIAVGLFERYNRLTMPNLRLNQEEIYDVIRYLEAETQRLTGDGRVGMDDQVEGGKVQTVSIEPAISEISGDVIALMNAWVRESRTGSTTNAGYLTLVNVGPVDVTLEGVACPLFERVEIHEMARVDGLMRMRALESVTIPAGERLQLKPGGKHLMLIRAEEKLVSGQRVPLTLQFADGRHQEITLPVAKR